MPISGFRLSTLPARWKLRCYIEGCQTYSYPFRCRIIIGTYKWDHMFGNPRYACNPSYSPYCEKWMLVAVLQDYSFPFAGLQTLIPDPNQVSYVALDSSEVRTTRYRIFQAQPLSNPYRASPRGVPAVECPSCHSFSGVPNPRASLQSPIQECPCNAQPCMKVLVVRRKENCFEAVFCCPAFGLVAADLRRLRSKAPGFGQIY